MEQTTDGTISYRRSISWSHRSASSDNPSSGLADVMLRKLSADFAEVKRVRRGDWIRGPHPSNCADLQTRGIKIWGKGGWWKDHQCIHSTTGYRRTSGSLSLSHTHTHTHINKPLKHLINSSLPISHPHHTFTHWFPYFPNFCTQQTLHV